MAKGRFSASPICPEEALADICTTNILHLAKEPILWDIFKTPAVILFNLANRIGNAMKRIFINVFLVCSVPFSCGVQGESHKESIENAVSTFFQSISRHDVEMLGTIIHQEGVLDGDTRFSRKTILNEIRDTASYIRQSLFRVPDKEELEFCLTSKSKILLVSPLHFFLTYRHSYTVTITRTDDSSDYFDVTILPIHVPDVHGECELRIPSLVVKLEDNKYYLTNYSF